MTDKVVEVMLSILHRDELPKPFGSMQLKGTDLCIDVHCICGEHSHFDGMFLYFFQCPKCQRIYGVGSYIRLYELSESERNNIPLDQIKTSEKADRGVTWGL